MKNKKRNLAFFFTVLIVIISILSSTIIASAVKKEDIPIPKVLKDVYVYDEDNIIDDDVEKDLNLLLNQLEEKTGAEVAVITVKSLLGMEIEDYSYELANTLGIGKKDEDNGVLLLISKSDTRVRLEIGEGLEGCLPDSKCGRILDNYFVPNREEGKYSEGTYQTIEAIAAVVAAEYEVTLEGIDETLVEELQDSEEDLGGLAIILFIIVIIILAVFIVLVFSSGDGSYYSDDDDSFSSGGGFSSGGFSGGSFGGGGFGGGGATR